MRRPAAVLALAAAIVLGGQTDAHAPYSIGVQRAREWLAERTTDRAFRCAHLLFDRESHWNTRAGEPGGAYGIPQSSPGRKMRSAERPAKGRLWDDWRTDALVQVAWGRRYVKARHGSFCQALRFQTQHGWY